MSSGTLPLSAYHRASSLGEGTYGSVVTVYDDDGNEFALKLFLDEDDESDVDDEDDESFREPDGAIDVGALREISALRVFRSGNSHPNVVCISDVKATAAGGGDCYDEEGEEPTCGAGTGGFVGMAMPLFHDGTVASAIDSGSLQNDRAAKVSIAHGLLSAVAYLHRNGVIHRDIKADNIMLVWEEEDDGGGAGGRVRPVLIDFSLAKLSDATMLGDATLAFGLDDGTTHTPECGTPTYRAPEVVSKRPYGLAADLWSVGVVLLELIQGRTLAAEKDGHASRLIDEAKGSLPDQPFPNLVRSLLEEDPGKRMTAREALDSPLFGKFGLTVDGRTMNRVAVEEALPFDVEDCDDAENSPEVENGTKRPNSAGRGGKRKGGKIKVDPKLAQRMRTVQRICSRLSCSHPLTRQAALAYSRQMEQLDDALNDIRETQALLDCVVLAARFFEKELPDLRELDECGDGGDLFANWTLEEYRDNELTIWMMMDYCLYPRTVVEWVS